MKFTRASLIGPIGLAVITAASGAFDAAEHSAPSMCPNVGETEAALSTVASTEQADEPSEARGPVGLVADALSKVCLSDDQRAKAEEIGKQVRGKERLVMDARHALKAALI